jgi:hypothetical protein
LKRELMVGQLLAEGFFSHRCLYAVEKRSERCSCFG